MKRRQNVEMGFYAGGQFHPIRASVDYDYDKAGEKKQKVSSLLHSASQAVRKREMRKIHKSKNGAKYIVKNGKKIFGAAMQKVLASERKNGSNSNRSTSKKKTTTAKRSNSTAKPPTAKRPATKNNPKNRGRYRYAPNPAHLLLMNPEVETQEFFEVPQGLENAYEMFQGREVDECLLIEAPDYFPDDVIVLGEMPNVDYITEKDHINAGETIHYTHEFGEEGGEQPLLCADREGNLLILGGDYTIHEEGIRN